MIRRWCVGIALVGMLGYAGLAAGAWLFVKYRRGVETVTYADIALPWRWPEYQIKRGEHAITLGFALLQRGKFDQGFYQLRVGMARAPGHRDGRLLLAQILANSRRHDLARNTLMDGLNHHASDPVYVGAVLEFLLSRQADGEVMSLGNRILAAPDGTPALRDTAALHAARAAYYRGKYDQADAYLHTGGLAANLNAALLIARMDWERGYRELALVALRELHQRHPEDEGIYIQLGEFLRESGQTDEARRGTVLHQVAHPDCPRPVIDRLLDLHRQSREDELRAAAQNALTALPQPAGLLALGDFAATTGRVELAQQVLEQASNRQTADITPLRLMVVESMLVANRHAEALEHVQTLLKQPGADPALTNVAQGLLAIAHFGLGDPVSAHSALMTLMVRPELRAESLLAIANRLVAMEQRAPAREILARAIALDRQNQPALARLIELDLEAENLAALPDNLRHLLTLRKPPRHVLTAAQRLLRQDRHLFLPGRTELLDALAQALARPAAASTAAG